jgi:hypothetical protein
LTGVYGRKIEDGGDSASSDWANCAGASRHTCGEILKKMLGEYGGRGKDYKLCWFTFSARACGR